MSFMKNYGYDIWAKVFLAACVLSLIATLPVFADDQAALSGWFTVIWGDEANGGSTEPLYRLTDGGETPPDSRSMRR